MRITPIENNVSSDPIKRVYLNGEDVTNKCLAVDVDESSVELILPDGEDVHMFGKCYSAWKAYETIRTGNKVIEREIRLCALVKRGDVRIVRKSDLPAE